VTNCSMTPKTSDDPNGDPVGWTIVAIGDDGSVLCQSPRGQRRRYWFHDPEKAATLERERDEARAAYQGMRETYVGMTGSGLANDVLTRNGYPHRPEWRKGDDT